MPTLQLKRGAAAGIPTPADGEPLWATDTHKLYVGQGGTAYEIGTISHDLLSSLHGDTVASAVSRGSLIYGNATPKWAELNIGTAGQILTTDGTDVSWQAPASPSHDLLSATHDDALASAVSRGSIVYGNATPKWAELAVGGSGTVLTSNGTDVSWQTPAGGSDPYDPEGFLMIPFGSGAPSTPMNVSLTHAQMYFDSTNNKLFICNPDTSAWKSVVLT